MTQWMIGTYQRRCRFIAADGTEPVPSTHIATPRNSVTARRVFAVITSLKTGPRLKCRIPVFIRDLQQWRDPGTLQCHFGSRCPDRPRRGWISPKANQRILDRQRVPSLPSEFDSVVKDLTSRPHQHSQSVSWLESGNPCLPAFLRSGRRQQGHSDHALRRFPQRLRITAWDGLVLQSIPWIRVAPRVQPAR